MAISPKTLRLRSSKAPNIPIGPVEYSQQYQDQFTNVLRLYFNQVDNFAESLSGVSGGVYLDFPHLAASSENSQYAVANTPTIVSWDFIESQNGFLLEPGLAAEALLSGIYKITYSLQLVNTDNAQHNVTVWLRVNDADLERSATTFTVPARKSAGVYGYVCGYSEAAFEMVAGDTVSLYWATSNPATANASADGIFMEYLPAQVSPFAAPSIPSAIGSITFVSRLPPSS